MKKRISPLFLAGLCLAAVADVDLRGVWHATGNGIDAEIKLPGTLADAKLGTKWTYETFKACTDRPQTGALVREYQTLGKVRYSRKVTLKPEDCSNGPLEISLERVMWASAVFFDGTSLGTCDSLATAHVFAIPSALVTPGEHTLVVEVDNSPRHGFSRYSHSYGPVMQSVWHGLLGELVIRRAHPLRTARVFADAPAKGVLRVEVPAAFDPSASEAKRLRASICDYLAKGDLSRARTLDLAALEHVLGQKLPDRPVAVQAPAEFASAPLYVEAATGVKRRNVDVAWERGIDGAKLSPGVVYAVEGKGGRFGTWADADGSYWFADKMKVTITGVEPLQGVLLVRFRDPNKTGRSGELTFEGKTYAVPLHQQNPQGAWWAKLPLLREDFLDGRLELTAQMKTGPNLMIDRIVIVPDKE